MPWSISAYGSKPGRVIEFPPGHTVTFGRTDKATEIFPDDQWMSSLHFSVGLAGNGPLLQNLSQTNGTEVNGARMDAGTLNAGDRVKAGNTTFVVNGPTASPYPARVRIGGWGFEFLPEGWQPVEGAGFMLLSDASFRATMTAHEESLPEGKTLPAYVQNQIELIRTNVAGASIEGPVAVQMRGAEEALALTVTSPVPSSGRAIQRQIYALHDGIVGVFTATVLDSQAEALRGTLSSVVRGLSYFQG